METTITINVLALIARVLSGASVRWVDCQPDTCQRVYFANHTSHLDAIVLWSTLPQDVRAKTRPVAAKEYWTAGPIRRYLSTKVFNAILIDRQEIKVHQSPVDLMIREIGQESSLIMFPEGGRSSGIEIGEFKSGLYYLCKKRPDLGVDSGAYRQHEPHPAAWRGPAGAAFELHHFRTAHLARNRRTQERLPPPCASGGGAVEGSLRSASMDGRTLGLIGGVLVLLGVATTVVRVLRRRSDSGINPAILETFGLRVRAWWILFATLAAAVLLGKVATVILFGLISFWRCASSSRSRRLGPATTARCSGSSSSSRRCNSSWSAWTART